MRWLTQWILRRHMLCPGRRRDPQARQEQREERSQAAAKFHAETVTLPTNEGQEQYQMVKRPYRLRRQRRDPRRTILSNSRLVR
jgi:hypothetical protein